MRGKGGGRASETRDDRWERIILMESKSFRMKFSPNDNIRDSRKKINDNDLRIGSVRFGSVWFG